jgi:hypothetical protein
MVEPTAKNVASTNKLHGGTVDIIDRNSLTIPDFLPAEQGFPEFALCYQVGRVQVGD